MELEFVVAVCCCLVDPLFLSFLVSLVINIYLQITV